MIEVAEPVRPARRAQDERLDRELRRMALLFRLAQRRKRPRVRAV